MSAEGVRTPRSCTVCRTDTTTAIGFKGDAEAVILAISQRLGVSEDEANRVVLRFAVRELGCDPGYVPEGEATYAVQLCRECAQRAGIPVDDLTERT